MTLRVAPVVAAAVLVSAGFAARAQDPPRLAFKPGIWEFTYRTDTRVRENGVERTSEKSRTLKNKIATPRSVDIFLTYFLSSQNDESHCRYLYLTVEHDRIRAEHLCDYQLDPGPLRGRTFSTKLDLTMAGDNAFMGETINSQTLNGQWALIEHESVLGRWVSAHR